jgi:hypothetical protein
MEGLEDLMFINNCVAMMSVGDVLRVETKNAVYHLEVDGVHYIVTGGVYGTHRQKLNGLPHMERQGCFIFADNPVFKHYITRTSEVVSVTLNEKVIFPDGR